MIMALVPEENIRLISDTFFFSSDIAKTIKGKEDKKEFGVNCKQMKRLKYILSAITSISVTI